MCVGGSEGRWRPRGRWGNSGTEEWVGRGDSPEAHAMRVLWAPFVHSPLASQSVGRPHLALCRRQAHSVTDTNLVKKCYANLSSLSSWRLVSLHDHRTAAPHRGSVSPASVFPCIGTGRLTIWACVMRLGPLQATAELRRCRAGPCGEAGWRGAPAGAGGANPGKGRDDPKGPAQSDELKRGVDHPFAVANGTAPFAATPTESLRTFGNPFLNSLDRLSGNVASR